MRHVNTRKILFFVWRQILYTFSIEDSFWADYLFYSVITDIPTDQQRFWIGSFGLIFISVEKIFWFLTGCGFTLGIFGFETDWQCTKLRKFRQFLMIHVSCFSIMFQIVWCMTSLTTFLQNYLLSLLMYVQTMIIVQCWS